MSLAAAPHNWTSPHYGSRRRLLATCVAGVVLLGFAAAVQATPASASTPNPTPRAGARKNATQLTFPISGTAQLSVDVGSGNALFTDNLVTLPGVVGDYPVSLSYNSSVFGSGASSAVTGDTGSGWAITGFDQRLVRNSDGSVTYDGPGGLTGVFTPAGSGFASPPQFAATLTGSASSGYTLTDHQSQEKLQFNTIGTLTSDTDRNGNTTLIRHDSSGNPSIITTTRGSGVSPRLVVTTGSGGRITTLTQQRPYDADRVIEFGYSSNGHLASVTDANGGITRFASASNSDTGQVTTITNPDGRTTTLSFTGGKVSAVSQQNPTGAGTSTTRLTYPSATRTLVADASTNQSQTVSAAPHTTYNLTSNSSMLVASATDPDGHQRSASYTTLNNIASTTPAAGGATSYSYGANGGESLTKITSPGGASNSAAYGNSGGSAYLPSSSTNDAGNALQLSYDSNGNQTGSQQSTSGPTANVTYNADGTAATSASPGAANGVTTRYAYDADHDLQTISAPANSSLGQRSYTWDDFARLATATDGNGNTTTYSYDMLDRITAVAYSDGTPTVRYTYNIQGKVTKRVDGSGTTTYGYDDLGYLLSVANTATGTTVTYTYDRAGALASTTDGNGTTSYGYDAAHLLTSMTYPDSGSMQTTRFANDANGRRTDVWMQSNADHSSWAAHEQYSYDASGRITHALGQNGPASNPMTVVDETLCYSAGAAAPSCPTTASADRTNIQWKRDTITGQTHTYSYDGSNRLTRDVVTGGNNPRTYSYGYDNAGNRTSSQVTGNNPNTQQLTFNAGNQITSTGYTYNAAGNMILNPNRRAVFNAAGQQTETLDGDDHVTYTWAGTNENELVKQVNPRSNTYTYSYGRPDKNGLPTIDSVKIDNGTGYVLSDPSGQPVMLTTTTGKNCLYLYDGTGNPVGLSTSLSVTALALQYDPYGASTRTDNAGLNGAYTTNPYGFGTGVVNPDTGEIRFGQRYYDPTTGTWTQQDTLNAPLDPANANRYTYAGDDPVNLVDPRGTCGFDSLSDFGDCIETPLAVATGCITGAASAIENFGVIGTAIAGGAGDTVLAAGGCVAGGIAGYYGIEVP